MLAFLGDAYSLAYGLVNALLTRLGYPAATCLLFLVVERLLPREEDLPHAALAEPLPENVLAEPRERERRLRRTPPRLAVERADELARLSVEAGVALEERLRLLGLSLEACVEVGVERVHADSLAKRRGLRGAADSF